MGEVSDWNVAAASNDSTPPDGFPEGQAPSTLNNSAREVMAVIKRWYNDISGVNTSAGSGNAYTLSASRTISAYAAGQVFMFIADRANTGSATLNVDSVGAKTIKKNHDVNLASNDIETNQLVVVAYEATDDTFQMLSPTANSATVPQDHLSGLGLSNNATDSDHDLDIATGIARDADDTTSLTLTSALTKQIDANWATGDDAGGFPSGLTLSADTWYHVFLVDDSNGDVDAGFDSSTTATNLLSDTGGSKYRRIGSVLTDSSSNIKAFTQSGDLFLWDAVVENDINDGSPGTSANTASVTVPTGFNVEAMLAVHVDLSTHVWVTSPTVSDVSPSATSNNVFAGSSDKNTNNVTVLTDTSAQIRYHSDADKRIRVHTIGWRDRRGK